MVSLYAPVLTVFVEVLIWRLYMYTPVCLVHVYIRMYVFVKVVMLSVYTPVHYHIGEGLSSGSLTLHTLL